MSNSQKLTLYCVPRDNLSIVFFCAWLFLLYDYTFGNPHCFSNLSKIRDGSHLSRLTTR